MFCDRCGTKLHENQSFCPTCGKPQQPAPQIPERNRFAGHVRLLGILWLALSAFRLLPGFFLMAIFRHSPRIDFLPPGVPFFVHDIVRGAGVVLLASAAAGILAGWGLLDRQPWARTLAIVLGALNLIDMPFGTALGVYTLWALLPAKSEQEYREIARAT